jgi:RNA polymerase sigma factor (sigma-70 family)
MRTAEIARSCLARRERERDTDRDSVLNVVPSGRLWRDSVDPCNSNVLAHRGRHAGQAAGCAALRHRSGWCFVCRWMNDWGVLDEERLNALYDAHARDLLGYLARRSGDPQLALDLLGATFLTAFEHRESWRGRSERELVAWLYRIAANTFVDHVRRGAAERRALSRLGVELRALSPPEVAAIAAIAGSSELEERVTAAFGELSAEQREALWLHVVEERPYPEVSAALGLSEPAVRARVSRGLRALRRATHSSREESS